MGRAFEAAAGLILLGCAGLLGEVAWSIVAEAPMPVLNDQDLVAPQAPGAEPQAGVTAARDLTRHLPLAGMPDAAERDPDACRRLEGYVVDAVHELRVRGKKPPFAPELLKSALDSQQCAVSASGVAEILGHLGAAYAEAGLEVASPMVVAQ